MVSSQKISKAFKYLKNKIVLSFKERRIGKLKYLYEKNNSDELIIVFSAFETVRKYNYMKTLSKSKIDKLFIMDTFGYKGSYYWYENGSDLPKVLVSKLIEQIGGGGYKHVYTAGSSKGGTCAIYYGLKYNATEVYSSACQYHVGQYLNAPELKPILEGMMGKNYDESDVKKLDDELPEMIRQKANSKTIINLFYSEKDPTYQKHIVDLKSDLERNSIKYTVKTDDYIDHGDNGIYFSAHLKEIFKN